MKVPVLARHIRTSHVEPQEQCKTLEHRTRNHSSELKLRIACTRYLRMPQMVRPPPFSASFLLGEGDTY
eukprot:scaffold244271_cov34-Prasinocladus_malaysianus.AAC.1